MKIIRNIKLIRMLKEKGPFFLPFILWIYLMRGFYSSGKVLMLSDARNFLVIIKYYLSNIMRGVYPLWNPFYVWGRPTELYIRLVGEFNPFLFIPAFLNKIGLNFELSYFIFINGYYFLGLFGFYLLAERIFRDRKVSYLALVLLFFSGLGINIYNDTIILFLFVAIVWFFYYLVSFTQDRKPVFLLGLTFASMIIAITNMPLYFVTIFLTFTVFFSIIFWHDIKIIFRSYFDFILKHRLLVAFCFLSLIVAFVPGIMWHIAGSNGEYVFSQRHAMSSDQHVASMTLDTINAGGMAGAYELHTLFSNLIDMQVGFLYVPIFAFLILAMGIIVPITKRMILFFSVGFFVCLIAGANATPLHKFLYDNIFFFRFFRNVHFLMWLVFPFFALFLAEQFRCILDFLPRDKKGKISAVLYNFATHLGLAIFLCFQENVIISSFVTIFLSFAFFTFWFLGYLKNRDASVLVFIFVVLSIQPIEAYSYVYKNSKHHMFSYSQDKVKPHFYFVRPEKTLTHPDKRRRYYGDFNDTSGFIEGQYIGLKWPYILHSKISHDVLKNYVKHKFIAYDRVEWMPPGTLDIRIEDTFKNNRNLAFVSTGNAHEVAQSDKKDVPLVAGIVTKDSDKLRILNFDLNFILFKTHFEKDKFLIYNDSYHPLWKATINGKPAEISRANIAFKGIWVPAGENIICMRYGSLARYYLYIFIVVFFFLFLAYLTYMLIKEND